MLNQSAKFRAMYQSFPISLLIPVLLLFPLTFASCGGDPDPTLDLPQDTDTLEADVIDPDNGTVDVVPDRIEEVAVDSIVGDTGPDIIEPGSFGAPCSKNEDCYSNLCIEGPEGFICTMLCLDGGCPNGFMCSGIMNTFPDTIFLCMPEFSKVCSACTADNQCAGGKCIEFPEGRFCTVPCTGDECPSNYECADVPDLTDRYCVPPSGSCLCRAKDEGTKRACQVTNDVGTCYGYESCDPDIGFAACDAIPAKAEECNGLDDDCNGKPDDGIGDGEPCDQTNEFGTCTGTGICMGSKGWACSAMIPAVETCNGIDDDCDGSTDEDFKVDDLYSTIENCGACNKSCEGIFPNATVACDVTAAVPRCVVVECEDGYYKLNDYQCIPMTSTICTPCVLDTDCILDNARCVELGDGGTYCGRGCVDSGECPPGYECLPFDGGMDQCVPVSGSCACDTPDPNITRVCTVSAQVDPDSPVYTCTGLQRCGEGGWTACELPAEECNLIDDNCDGKIDENFTEVGTGRYVSDSDCGVCGNNCSAQTVPNGYGVCDTDRTIPDCRVECNNNFFNVDGNPANGCECEYVSADDPPGGGDADCDGIDGKTDGAIFVAKWGQDTSPGSIEQPLKTLGAAFTMAQSTGKDVYVATGIYTEPVSIRTGVSVYGGFSADFRILDPVAYETVILGQEPTPLMPGAVNAVSVNSGTPGSTVFSGFVVIAYNNRTPGQNSIAMYVRDCGNALTVQNCRFVGGLAGNGAAGALGLSGEDGISGAAGTAAFDVNNANCGTSTNAGGTGGSFSCGGTSVAGGNGGTAICPDFDEDTGICPTDPTTQTRKANENGATGANGGAVGGIAGLDALINPDCSFFGSCGTCNVPAETRTGAPGTPGAIGQDGPGGIGCATTEGSVVDGVWVPAAALSGGVGTHGGGGGGGGAAGGVETANCGPGDGNRGYSDLGGSGGGGGSGGCGATGGTAGGSGGGSFALFVVFTSTPVTVPTINNVVVEPGQGGNGGNGGPAGVGGKGGSGALGGADGAGVDLTFCAGGGGAGGNGGAGGHGGGGGGGCGGPAYGLFVNGVDTGLVNGWKTSITFNGAGEGGAGGTGGTSFGADGTDGAQGVAANSNF